MFPESDLTREFWHFVFARALDTRANETERPRSQVLDSVEARRHHMRFTFDDLDDFSQIYLEYKAWPHVFNTLQEALVAFLIDAIAKNQWRYPYEVWLRVVVLVLADAQRQPDYFLKVTARYFSDPEEFDPQNPSARRLREAELTMTISDDWSCLSRGTFAAIEQAHRATEPPDPHEPDTPSVHTWG